MVSVAQMGLNLRLKRGCTYSSVKQSCLLEAKSSVSRF